jgi:hypothetical protein
MGQQNDRLHNTTSHIETEIGGRLSSLIPFHGTGKISCSQSPSAEGSVEGNVILKMLRRSALLGDHF